MSRRLYAYFKPEKANISVEQVKELINTSMPNLAEIDEDDGEIIYLDCKWSSYIQRSDIVEDFPDFPYWNIFFWCYWDQVLNGMELRRFMKNICEALGTNKWWYVEETSMDLFDDMNTEEFEAELEKAVGIEDFSQPRYFPNSPNHLFMDSSIKVNAVIDR